MDTIRVICQKSDQMPWKSRQSCVKASFSFFCFQTVGPQSKVRVTEFPCLPPKLFLQCKNKWRLTIRDHNHYMLGFWIIYPWNLKIWILWPWNTGISWNIVEYCGMLWNILEYCGILWIIVKYCRILWNIGISWNIV